MHHFEIKEVLERGHAHWKTQHIPGDITIQSLLKSWDDPELIRIGMHLNKNLSSSNDPEDWIWGKMIYLHYYAVYILRCTEEVDNFVKNTEISDFEKLVRVIRILMHQTRIQERTDSILSVNRV